MANPVFTITFNIDESNWRNPYRTLIENIRERVSDPNNPYVCVNDPSNQICRRIRQLPLEDPDQVRTRQRWFAVVLQTSNASITLRIRVENIYLDAYQRGNEQTWYAFSSSYNNVVFSNFRVLISDGSYQSMERRVSRRTIALTPQRLIRAINFLAATADARTDRLYEHLIVVIQMISESVRFEKITKVLADQDQECERGAPSWMLACENAWSNLSKLFYKYADDPSQPCTIPKELMDKTGIRSCEDLYNALGILKPDVKSHRDPPTRRRQRRLQGYQEDVFGGGPKVEVFQCLINSYDGDVYGEIKVTHAFTQFIYSRGRYNNPQRSNISALELTGPTTAAIFAGDPFTIDVQLWRRSDRYNHPSFDSVISRGSIFWNVYNLDSNRKYDEFIEETIRGDNYNNFARIQYAVFSDAVEANIEVTLVATYGINYYHFRGFIYAENSKLSDCVSPLLSTDGYIESRPGKLLPLSKTIVAVPFDSDLYVHAELWGSDWGMDGEIANGYVIFQPKLYGTETLYLSGSSGQIAIKVTWKI